MKSDIKLKRRIRTTSPDQEDLAFTNMDTPSTTETLLQKTDSAEVHRYSRHVFNSTAMLFLANAFFLCFSGYMTSWTKFNVSTWYGFTTPNLHLQRVSGVMLLLAAALNFFAARNEHLVYQAMVHDTVIFAFYILEAAYYRSVRMETLIIFGMFISANLFWSFREVVSHTLFRKERERRIEEQETVPLQASSAS